MKTLTEEIECFLFDLDGTIYLEDRLIDGALETLAKIKKSGKMYKFITNNSSKSLNEYCRKLDKLGIKTDALEIITSNMTAIDYLKTNLDKKSVYLVATKEVAAEYKAAGINIVNNFPDVVVLTYDTSLTYDKLSKAAGYIAKGAFYIATHPDLNCPAKDGYLIDLGSIMEGVYASTKRRADIICGKPDKVMGEYIKKICNLTPDKIAMVGDRMYTDMQFAINSSFKSILVLSGETKKNMVNVKYDLVIDSVKDLF